MNALKNKIKSQRGASITFALLLFLVCSVVSIVVVVAGSAAAGRMSQRAETDQRYYAVTSAVELLCDDFKGMTVSLQAPAENVAERDIDKIEIIDADGNPKNVADCGILTAVSKQLVIKLSTDPGTGSLTPPDDDTLTLTVNGGPANAALDCTINEYIKGDGRVIFEVSNDKTTDDTKQYTLQVVFDANISQSTSQYRAADGTVKDRVKTTLVWSLNGIEKGSRPNNN